MKPERNKISGIKLNHNIMTKKDAIKIFEEKKKGMDTTNDKINKEQPIPTSVIPRLTRDLR